MKMIAGAAFRAAANRSRTRDAPTPTNSSTKLDPVSAKNGTLASPATARARSVFPVPGGPTMSTPRGATAPARRVPLGMTQEVDDLADLALRALVAGDVVEARRRTSARRTPWPSTTPKPMNPAGELAGRATADPEEEAEQHDERQQPADDGPETRRGPGTLDGDVVRASSPANVSSVNAVGNPRLVVLLVDEFARDLAVGIDGRRLHLVGVDLRLPGGVAQRWSCRCPRWAGTTGAR